ncbi:hypothetical protein [Wenjunlia tyrosinilytica]|uniref:Uncharacterized protein n=1 Tax=Wenjunlia tyrosinilytica TaxID=1544741 RepID=A0A918DUL3_9ACTN|nr:hypothetical protein [Wenjunlia tyrosinilytica]GGO84666.1 hypothetical protein GCM10012280_16660 [Wenjunlia tyrosinilytica]
MTMRVYSVDPATGERRIRRAVAVTASATTGLALDQRFPPCRCPRCRNGLRPDATAQAPLGAE